jgi:hypothetical protein
MPRVKDVYGGNTLKAEDLPPGRDITVQIESTKLVEYDEGPKIVLNFSGKEKCLALNVTNATQVADLLGTDNYDNWPGARITLYVTKVNFQGKMVPAIRIRDSVPGQGKFTQAAPPPIRQAPPTRPHPVESEWTSEPMPQGNPGQPAFAGGPPAPPLTDDDIPF